MRCLVCNREVIELEHFSDDDPAANCWDGGIVEWVIAGYGSAYDCSRFLVCICDACVTERLAVTRSWKIPAKRKK